MPGFNSYEVILPRTKTGKNIIELLNYCNFKFEDIFWTNLFKCILPLDKYPSKKEYNPCLEKKLNVQIRKFNPEFIYVGIKTLIFPLQKIAPHYCNLKRKGELFVMVNDFLNS